jgi:hypothetical protein
VIPTGRPFGQPVRPGLSGQELCPASRLVWRTPKPNVCNVSRRWYRLGSGSSPTKNCPLITDFSPHMVVVSYFGRCSPSDLSAGRVRLDQRLTSINNLAVLRIRTSTAGWKRCTDKSSDNVRQFLGQDHPSALTSTSNLAAVLRIKASTRRRKRRIDKPSG